MPIPRVYPIRKLIALLKKYGIRLNVSHGKGSHGSFEGKDIHGNDQSFPLPRAQIKKEISSDYIKPLLRRFGLTEAIFDE
jgi:hypothetical protein